MNRKSPQSIVIASAIAFAAVAAMASRAADTKPATRAAVAGKEYTHPIRYEIWAPKEVKKSTKEVHRLWIPDAVEKVRAVIVVPDYSNDKAIYFSDALGYRQFAQRMGAALMAYRIFNEDSDATRDEATRDMLGALATMGEASGHPELAHASLIPIGLSWGGRCAAGIALSAPERTIGFVPLHCTLTFKEILASKHKEAFFKVPGLCETAEFEEYHNHDPKRPDLEGTDPSPVVLACNAVGAIHASYIFPKSHHGWVRDPEFIMRWMEIVTEKRLPPSPTFDAPPELKPLARESGWLGTYEYEHHWKPDGKFDRFEVKSAAVCPFAEFKGEPGTAHWLPDEATAKAWKAKMGF